MRAKRDGLTSHERLIKPRATRRSVIRTRQSGHATWDPFWSHDGGGGGGWFYLDKPVQFALDVGFERGKKTSPVPTAEALLRGVRTRGWSPRGSPYLAGLYYVLCFRR